MKPSLLAIFAIASLLLFSGCELFGANQAPAVEPPAAVPPPEAMPPPAEKTPPPEVIPPPPEVSPPPPAEDAGDAQLSSEGDTPLTSLFGFSNYSKVVFRKVTYEKGYPDFREVTMQRVEDIHDGLVGWKVVTTSTTESSEDILWVSKETLRCRDAEKLVNGSSVEASCPVLGPFGTSRTSRNVQLLGNENVIVSLGTFDNTPKYSGDGVTYWMAAGKPFPIKYVVMNGTTILETYELVGWS